jgi:AAA+ superfamily predicted ATPase
VSAIPYYVSRQLATLFPDKTLMECDDAYFDVETYAQDGQCSLELLPHGHNELTTNWNETFTILILHWVEDGCSNNRSWLLAETEQIAHRFIEAVCAWNAEIRGEILVFDDGSWRKDEQLFHAIKNATFDNLILQDTLKEEILADLERFFSARAAYNQYHIPWKRGILFVGTPGNGKTHTVKALLNALGRPCLYVKSFKAQYRTDDKNISEVFTKARKAAPCILVLEDLEALLTDENRSFFLNELDGFAVNTGIVILATTNHPERLDPALTNRPSRFDRKYAFNLPAQAERVKYISLWNASLDGTMHLTEETVLHLAELTTDFSFAYLKELFLSSLMRWMTTREQMAGIQTVEERD